MRLAAETLGVAFVGGFPIWALVSVRIADRLRNRHEHPEHRALRVLAEQDAERRWWSNDTRTTLADAAAEFGIDLDELDGGTSEAGR